MKCDELKAEPMIINDDYTALYYPKDSVDAAIAELKDENRMLKRALWISRAKAYRYIAELITCFNPDYVRNRKMYTPNNLKQKQMSSLKWARLMLKIEGKCRAKAEEYK